MKHMLPSNWQISSRGEPDYYVLIETNDEVLRKTDMSATQTSCVTLYLSRALVSGVRGMGGVVEDTRQHPQQPWADLRVISIFLPTYTAYDGQTCYLFTRFARLDKI